MEMRRRYPWSRVSDVVDLNPTEIGHGGCSKGAVRQDRGDGSCEIDVDMCVTWLNVEGQVGKTIRASAEGCWWWPWSTSNSFASPHNPESDGNEGEVE